MAGNPIILGKVFVAIGGGGSPIAFYALPSSFVGEQRQFKLDLNLKNSKVSNETLTSNSEGKFELKQKWLLSSNFWGLRRKIENKAEKNIYKLVFKKEVEAESRDVFEKVGIKGAFGLIKATWGGTKKWEVGEVSVDEKNKVWLIVAKGDKAMYLMPVVRESWWLGDNYCSPSKSKEGAEKEVNEKGVEDIKQWSNKFDLRKNWREDKNLELQKLMNAGFSITRKAEIAKWEWTEGGAIRKAEESAVNLAKKLKIDQSYSIATGGKLKFLYKNAGILNLSDLGEGTRKCNEIEHYYPLDLVILNKTSEETEGKVTVDNEGKITITDTISEVFGARLDQVVIGKKGIGNGNGTWLNWGTVDKPFFSIELLK